MAKTRLSNEDRSAIRVSLLNRKYAPLYNALRARENAAASAAWDQAYGKYRKHIEALPEGALGTDVDISVNANGFSVQLRYSGGYRNGCYADSHPDIDHTAEVSRPEFANTRQLNLTGELADQVSSWAIDLKELDDAFKAMAEKLAGTLAKFTTFEGLLEAWPEAELFVQKRMAEKGLEIAPNLPAALIFDLTRDLDLPPEEVAKAA